MSLKITNAEGFKIGGVANPSITDIYVRVLPNLQNEKKVNETEIEVNSQAKTTINGGRFDDSIQVDGISPIYWPKYDSDVADMNAQYLDRNDLNEVVSVSIFTEASTTILGGIEEDRINVQGINPIYWLNYSATVSDMNVLYTEIRCAFLSGILCSLRFGFGCSVALVFTL